MRLGAAVVGGWVRGPRLRRAGPYLVAVLIAVSSIFGLVARPATGTPTQQADYVVIAGAAGLRWDDVNPTDTPAMWSLAQHGSIGALSVRSAHAPTCPVDGWLTLGAGNLARTERRAAGACQATSVNVQSPDGIGGNLGDEQQRVVQLNRTLTHGAQPGALAEAVRCTTAVGQGAAVAAARPFGRVDRYAAALPQDPASLLATCVLSIVDIGTVSGSDPSTRRTQARAADATLAAVLAARPADSLVMVAGLADTDQVARLHVAIADGPGFAGGWLTSSSTSRPGYVQLTDLAPTALNVLGKSLPSKLFTGQPAASLTSRPANLASAVSALSDADREAGAQTGVASRFYLALIIVELLLFGAAVPLLRRARRHAGPRGVRPAPGWLVRAEEVALVAAALSLPAALLADAVPWWRSAAPGLLFSAVTLAVTAALTASVVAGPWWQGAVGPVGAVGGITAAIVGLDVLTGSRLQLNGVAGYSTLSGNRYAGVGTVGLGLVIAGVLLIAGWLAQRAARPWRPAVMAVVGAVGVVLVGSPYLGADVGGAVALTAGVCVAAVLCTGGWLTFSRLAWATLAGLAVTVGFAALDLRRPAADRGSLGHLLTEARDGTANAMAHRVAAANAASLLDSPLTVLALGGAALAAFALIRPWGGLKRLFGLYPAVRAALIGGTTAALLAGVLDGTALDVAGAATAIGVPLAALAALRVLDHADDRTVAEAVRAAIAEPVSAVHTPDRPTGAAAGEVLL
ncbi:MAG: hypothetical protein V7603_404 [Micromonosporaceae bacterium]